ncbi:hypothetical protein M1I95_09855 [Rossellomorea marisflavi]|uniref:hypothetical protein n=1 Tax=Rossellomorea marisflavi TaxID=189381 RepID=UPI0027AB7E3F|nr:hypothetical protein [Rossellomorea marisflavi]UTE74718.1 hypothetical protein M1I95_09855 [Rossellomorea marisflavi]
MGFLKELGQGAGWLVGGVTGGLIKGVGEVTGSPFIKEVGDGVKYSSEFAGKQLGNLSEGVWNVGSGLITKDERKIEQGFDDLGKGVFNTAKAVGHSAVSTAKSVGHVAGGLMDGDETRWMQGLRDVGKTVAVGALGVSILDAVDVLDINGDEGGDDSPPSQEHMATGEAEREYIREENSDSHRVEPYERTLPSGETIWVDGDGDTSMDRTAEEGGGWSQSNPDYRTPVGRG